MMNTTRQNGGRAAGLTAAGLMQSVGSVALLECDALKFPVKIIDAKASYGRERFLVVPIGGRGECWVDSSRVLERRDA